MTEILEICCTLMLKRDESGITSSAWLHKVQPMASRACGDTTLNGVSLEFCLKGKALSTCHVHNPAGLCSL